MNRQHIPNAITVARLLIAVAIGVCTVLPFNTLAVVQALVVAGIVSDKLDGTLARAWGVESELGKKLESVVDPLFNLLCGLYIITRLEFPMTLFWIGLAGFGLTVVARIVVRMRTGKFFYQKSPITRYGTVSIFVLELLYLFALPYRHVAAVLVCAYGCVVVVNYVLMIARFLRTTAEAAERAHQKTT